MPYQLVGGKTMVGYHGSRLLNIQHDIATLDYPSLG